MFEVQRVSFRLLDTSFLLIASASQVDFVEDKNEMDVSKENDFPWNDRGVY